MKGTKFKEQNKVLSKPDSMTNKECYALPVFNDGKQSISCWRASWVERFKVLFTGRVWLTVHFGVIQTPVRISAHYPFNKSSK